jgi:hypothetical protein
MYCAASRSLSNFSSARQHDRVEIFLIPKTRRRLCQKARRRNRRLRGSNPRRSRSARQHCRSEFGTRGGDVKPGCADHSASASVLTSAVRPRFYALITQLRTAPPEDHPRREARRRCARASDLLLGFPVMDDCHVARDSRFFDITHTSTGCFASGTRSGACSRTMASTCSKDQAPGSTRGGATRLEGAYGRVEPSQEDAARRASESPVSEDSLVPEDIIVTDRGMFVFRGRSKETEIARDFEPIEDPAGLKAKGK